MAKDINKTSFFTQSNIFDGFETKIESNSNKELDIKIIQSGHVIYLSFEDWEWIKYYIDASIKSSNSHWL